MVMMMPGDGRSCFFACLVQLSLGGGVQIRLLHSLRKKVPQFVSVLASPPSQYALRFRQPDGSLHSTHGSQDGVK